MAIDVERLLAEALTRHGIRLDPNDPAVVLVTLNRLVVEDVAKSVAADMRKVTREFEEAGNRLQTRVGAAIATSLKVEAGSGSASVCWRRRAYLALGLGSGAGLFLTGIAVGKWVLR